MAVLPRSRFGRFVLRHGTRYARRWWSYFRLCREFIFIFAPLFGAYTELGTDPEPDAIDLPRLPKDPFSSLLPSV
jgi:hypothetical protein